MCVGNLVTICVNIFHCLSDLTFLVCQLKARVAVRPASFGIMRVNTEQLKILFMSMTVSSATATASNRKKLDN